MWWMDLINKYIHKIDACKAYKVYGLIEVIGLEA